MKRTEDTNPLVKQVIDRAWTIRFGDIKRDEEQLQFFKKNVPQCWADFDYLDVFTLKYVIDVDSSGNVNDWAC